VIVNNIAGTARKSKGKKPLLITRKGTFA